MIDNSNSTYHILICDDEIDLLDLLRDYLKEGGYDVSMASKAEEALNLLSDIKFNLVISDVRMPGMSGFEFSKLLKQNYPGIPLIFVTGNSRDFATEFKECQYEGVLDKPFFKDEILQLVNKILKKS